MTQEILKHRIRLGVAYNYSTLQCLDPAPRATLTKFIEERANFKHVREVTLDLFSTTIITYLIDKDGFRFVGDGGLPAVKVTRVKGGYLDLIRRSTDDVE